MPSTEYNLRYDIGPDYNLNFSTASGDLSNLLVQCIDGSGTFNIVYVVAFSFVLILN